MHDIRYFKRLTFFKRLQLLVEKCECSALTIQEHKNILLRDSLVSGLRSDIIRAKLLELTKAEASVDKCKSLAIAIEMSIDFPRSFFASGSSTSDSPTSSIAAVYDKRDKGQLGIKRSFPRLSARFLGKSHIHGSNVPLKKILSEMQRDRQLGCGLQIGTGRNPTRRNSRRCSIFVRTPDVCHE